MANRRRVDREERKRARRAALRWAGHVGIRLLFVASLLVGVPWAGTQAYRWAVTTPTFAVSEITISGASKTSEAALRSRLGIAEGDNIFLADVNAAEERLSSLPWIEEARVRTRFPQGVIVEVLEREAVALVDLGHLYLVDRKGRVFKRVMKGDPLDLPVITNLPRDEWAEPGGVARERLGWALEALEILENHPIASRLTPQELHVDDGEGLTLFLGERGMMVRLGHGDLVRKLDRLLRVHDEAQRRGERIEMVRLDNRTRPEWIAARLATSGRGKDSSH